MSTPIALIHKLCNDRNVLRDGGVSNGVAEVERRLSVVEEFELVVSANLQRATRLRQSISQKAFTGELI